MRSWSSVSWWRNSLPSLKHVYQGPALPCTVTQPDTVLTFAFCFFWTDVSEVLTVPSSGRWDFNAPLRHEVANKRVNYLHCIGLIKIITRIDERHSKVWRNMCFHTKTKLTCGEFRSSGLRSACQWQSWQSWQSWGSDMCQNELLSEIWTRP
jgi:hypothetical protein